LIGGIIEHHFRKPCSPSVMSKIRIAVVVSHPVQYYVPLYRRLAKRGDVELLVFFTWHGGVSPVVDAGFGKPVFWDIPLLEGYESEVVPNEAVDPGTHHFWGMRNRHLASRILNWSPDVVHLTGYAYDSHLRLLWVLARSGVPVLFRGDSHLLNEDGFWRKAVKAVLLRWVYSLTGICLYVGVHNREYFRRFGVPESRLAYCPHSVEVERFSEPAEQWEREAEEWRKHLAISDGRLVFVYAGKFEQKKRPLELMRAVSQMEEVVLVMVGDGLLGGEVRKYAELEPGRFRVLPFVNQSRMPVVYRLGDVVVLASTEETWGLAVNEAQASGRPVLVSDAVGCAPDLVVSGQTGEVFRRDDWDDFRQKGLRFKAAEWFDRRESIRKEAVSFSIRATEEALMAAVDLVRERV
jgi:glycosyltransferase involved in cell wall biosynthesis